MQHSQTHVTHSAVVALMLIRTGWSMVHSFRKGRKLVIELARAFPSPVAFLPEQSAECIALARDAERADVQDKAADFAELRPADVDAIADRVEG